MEATHITSNPRSGKLGMINEDDDVVDLTDFKKQKTGNTINLKY